MSISIDSIELNIKQNTENASQSIEKLTKSLRSMKTALNNVGKINVDGITSAFNKINGAINTLTTSGVRKLQKLANAMHEVSKASKSMGGLGNVNKQMSKMSQITEPVNQAVNPTSQMPITPNAVTPQVETKIAVDTSQVTEATAEVRQMGDAVNEASNQATKSESKFKQFFTKLKDGFKQLVEHAKKFSNETNRASGSHSKLLASIGRIGMYRAIRSAFKAVTSGIREGITNLIEYSKAINDTDSAMAHSTTTQFATQFLYLKNSVASAVAPLLQELLPVIKQVVAWFVAGANAVNQFISALQGKSTYTKAKEYTQETEDNLKGAVGSAKALKKELLGLDELNVLTTDTSGGGGANVSTPDYSQMFEEANIDKGILDFAEKFKTIFGDVGTMVETIGWAIAGWSIGKQLFNQLFGSTNSLSSLVKGGLELIVGMYFSFQGGQKIGAGDTSGITESITGWLLSALGGVNIATALGKSAISGGLAGLAIGLAITSITALVTFNEEMIDKAAKETDLGKSIEELGKKIQEDWQVHLDIQAQIDSITGELSPDVQANFEVATNLVNEIFELDSKDNKTAKEIEIIKDKIKILNGLGFGDLIKGFDDLTGHVIGSKEEVLELIEALKKQAKIEALKDSYVKALQLQAEAEDNLNDLYQDRSSAFDNLTEATDKVTLAQKAYDDAIADFHNFGGTTLEDIAQLNTDLEIAKENADDARDAFRDVTEKVGEAEKTFKKANKKVETMSFRLDEMYDAELNVVEETDKVNDTTSDMQDALGETKRTVNGLTKAVSKSYEGMVNWNKLKLTNKSASIEIMTTIQQMQEKGQREQDRWSKIAEGTAKAIQSDADGGMVSGGHLFFANENGNPEYIGSINGKTAVANRDQMSEAIENASFRGMARALKENGGNKDTVVIIEPNSSNLFKVTQKEAKDYYNRTGRQAFGY